MNNHFAPGQRSPYFRAAAVWAAMLLIWLLHHSLRIWLHGKGYSLSGHIQSAFLATLLAVPMVALACRWFDGGSLADLGLALSFKAALRPFAIGALSFLLPSALGFAIVLGFGWVTITPLAPLHSILAFVPLLVALVILYEALPEELAFRGYLYRVLAERHSRLLAIFTQALLFGLWGGLLSLYHSGTLHVERLVIFVSVALVLGFVRVVANSVWAAIGLHTAFQTVAQLLLNEERGHFAISGSASLELIALGILPLALATTLVGGLYRRPAAWKEPEGERYSGRLRGRL